MLDFLSLLRGLMAKFLVDPSGSFLCTYTCMFILSLTLSLALGT